MLKPKEVRVEITLGIDTVIAGISGVVAGALPSVLRAIWRECVQRRKQKHRLDIRRIDKQTEMVLRGMEMGYTVTSTSSTDTYKPRTNKDRQDRAG